MSKTVLEQSAKRLEGFVGEYNKAFLSKNFEAIKEAEENLTKELKVYKKAASDAVLYRLKGTENPVLEAVKQLTYEVFRTKTVKDDNGNDCGIELVVADARIDLVKVCEYCGLPTVWKYKVEKLALLLALRAAKELKIPASEIKVMNYKFKMDELARKVDLGETPDSNNQITKAIQSIMDEVLPGLGKANAHDAAYMWMASTRAGREAKCLKVADARMAHRLFADVANRIVTKGRYTVDYKMEKAKTEAKKSEPETVVVPDENAA